MTNSHHQHNVVYHAECPEPNCSSNYTGQTKCRLLKRVIQHNRTDKNSHLLKHSSSNNHHRVWMDDFKVLGSGYKWNIKRKISEALFIKEKKPDLNVQKDAYTLKLYHWRHNVSEFQYQAPDYVLWIKDEILSFYEINKVNDMILLVEFYF